MADGGVGVGFYVDGEWGKGTSELLNSSSGKGEGDASVPARAEI